MFRSLQEYVVDIYVHNIFEHQRALNKKREGANDDINLRSTTERSTQDKQFYISTVTKEMRKKYRHQVATENERSR